MTLSKTFLAGGVSSLKQTDLVSCSVDTMPRNLKPDISMGMLRMKDKKISATAEMSSINFNVCWKINSYFGANVVRAHERFRCGGRRSGH